MSHNIDLWRLNSANGDISDWVASHSFVSRTTFWASLQVLLALFFHARNSFAYSFRESAVPGASTTSSLVMARSTISM